MRRVSVVLGLLTLLSLTVATSGTPATPAENPYQAELGFALGKPVEMRVDVSGVTLDTITVTARSEVRAGANIKCDVEFVGNNASDKKANLTTVLLLEDAEGKGLSQGRVTLDPFKVKSGKTFDELQTITVPGDVLSAAVKVYVLVEVGF
jgi:hypothetical protein